MQKYLFMFYFEINIKLLSNIKHDKHLLFIVLYIFIKFSY